MPTTHEQDVVTAKDKIALLQSDFQSALERYLKHSSQDASSEESLSALQRVHSTSNLYLNYVEDFVGNSDLLGAHLNAKWVTGLAEDCEAHLTSWIFVHTLLTTAAERSGYPYSKSTIAATAYANMQRMVAEYMPAIAKDLEERISAAGLPTHGFKRAASSPQAEAGRARQRGLLSVGIGFLAVTLILAFAFDSPTPFQQMVVRGCFSVGLASACTHIPGFLNLSARVQSGVADGAITAGGSLAVFVLTWLFNPPAL